MGLVSNQFPIQEVVTSTRSRRSDAPSLGTKAFAVASAILLTTGGALGAPLSANLRRLQGGVQIPQPDFNTLSAVTPQFGPFHSSQLACHLAHITYPPMADDCPPESLFPVSLKSYIDEVSKEVPAQVRPYLEAVEGLHPVRNKNVGKFPENMSAFLHKWMGLVGNGNAGCKLTEDLDDYKLCIPVVEEVVTMVKERKLESKYYSDDAFQYKGGAIALQNKDSGRILHEVMIGLNPQAHTNYKKALDLATETLLTNDCFFRKSPEEIVSLLREMHAIVTKDLPEFQEEEYGRNGEFRKRTPVLYKNYALKKNIENDLINSWGVLIKHLATLREVTPKDEEDIQTVVSKYILYEDDYLKELTPDERAIWEEVVYIPPEPSDLERKMKLFAEDLKTYAMQEIHPVALAAWVHAEFGRMQPFYGGVGRIARLLMNALLVRGGYEPVVISDKEAYNRALIDDLTKPGTFAQYLADLIKTQSQVSQVLMHVKDD